MRPAVDSLVTFYRTTCLTPDPPVPASSARKGADQDACHYQMPNSPMAGAFRKKLSLYNFRELVMSGQTHYSRTVSRTAALLMAVLSLGVLMAAGRTIRLQYYPQHLLSATASRQHQRVIKKRAYRGSIFDREMRVLVSSVNASSIFIDPAALRRPGEEGLSDNLKFKRLEALTTALSSVLEIDFSELWEHVRSRGHTRFIWVARRLDAEKELKLRSLMESEGTLGSFRGAFFTTEPKREYPLGSLAGQVLGAIGNHGEGMSGIESSWEAELGGTNGFQSVMSDVRNRKTALPDLDYVPSRSGRNVHLTIDANVQEIVEKELDRLYEEFQPTSTFGIVTDPTTGDILALAAAPAFDPDLWEDYRMGDRLRLRTARPVTDCYELGSVIKPIIAASAVNQGVLNLDSSIHCGNGVIKTDDGFNHKDHNSYGPLTVTKVLAKSSNIGAYKIMKSLGRPHLYRYFDDFGFGKKSGVTFPGESSGKLWSVEEWKKLKISSWNLAIGYGTSISPLQLAMAYGVIANGGNLMTPRLVTRVENENGVEVQNYPVTVKNRVIGQTIAKQMREALETVLSKDATGRGAAVEGYRIAGKTGTAEKLLPKRDAEGNFVRNREGKIIYEYDKHKHVASFVGFAPVGTPRLLVYVGVDQPTGTLQYGGQVAAPAVGNIFKKLFEYYRMEPDREVVH
ncbi:MAG: penicillin-binding protein 2 [Planctomycetota bacterium]|nr:penicillin-binding protein 2 [Planctomycetota bacterium]MDA1140754.1 penicillin-binding protein 2 [Planctomycetota bacterium]